MLGDSCPLSFLSSLSCLFYWSQFIATLLRHLLGGMSAGRWGTWAVWNKGATPLLPCEDVAKVCVFFVVVYTIPAPTLKWSGRDTFCFVSAN